MSIVVRILGAILLILVALATVMIWRAQPEPLSQARSEWMNPQDQLVTAAGQTWRVRTSGPDNAPTLVLIHGFSHSLETWEPLAAQLETSYQVIRFDLPGHGLSDVRADQAYSVNETVDQVSALLDTIAPERFYIGGNSLGGLVAWRYGAEYPQRTQGLILISPGGYPNLGVGDEPAPLPAQVRFYLAAAPQVGVEAATAALYSDPSRLTEEQLVRIGALMRVDGVGEALISRVEQFTLPDPNPTLREIDAPALIIWGARDAMIPATHGPRFNAALSNSELLLLRDVGHMAQAEAPDAVAEAIDAFIAD